MCPDKRVLIRLLALDSFGVFCCCCFFLCVCDFGTKHNYVYSSVSEHSNSAWSENKPQEILITTRTDILVQK